MNLHLEQQSSVWIFINCEKGLRANRGIKYLYFDIISSMYNSLLVPFDLLCWSFLRLLKLELDHRDNFLEVFRMEMNDANRAALSLNVLVDMQPLSGDEIWNVAWHLDCVCVCARVRVRAAKKEKLSSIFHEETGGVLTGFCYNNCKKKKPQTNKSPLNWWFVVVLNPDLFIFKNQRTLPKKTGMSSEEDINQKNEWHDQYLKHKMLMFSTIHCLSIQMHPFLTCSHFLPVLKVYKQLALCNCF